MTQQTLKQMQGLFEQEVPLADKQAQVEHVYKRGACMLFSGALNWTIELPEEDRLAEGHAESMDDAVQAMLASLRLFERHYGDVTPVRLTVQALGVQEQDSPA